MGKIPWKRKWQPTPVFLPGESHGQRNLADYKSLGFAELNMTEQESTGREQYFTASTQLSPGSLRSNPKFAIYILCAHFGSYITLPQFPLLLQVKIILLLISKLESL